MDKRMLMRAVQCVALLCCSAASFMFIAWLAEHGVLAPALAMSILLQASGYLFLQLVRGDG